MPLSQLCTSRQQVLLPFRSSIKAQAQARAGTWQRTQTACLADITSVGHEQCLMGGRQVRALAACTFLNRQASTWRLARCPSVPCKLVWVLLRSCWLCCSCCFRPAACSEEACSLAAVSLSFSLASSSCTSACARMLVLHDPPHSESVPAQQQSSECTRV